MARAMNRSPEQLRRWAHEHLVYEAGMLMHVVRRVADRGLSDQDRNAFVESFAIHVRCLRDFLWSHKRGRPGDALASDFCASGVWEQARPALPDAVRRIEGSRNRIGREIVHLTYQRLGIGAEAKARDMSELLDEIADALAHFAQTAEPRLLTEESRQFLISMPSALRGHARLPPSVAPHLGAVTGASQAIGPTRGGTIAFPGHSANDIEPDSPA